MNPMLSPHDDVERASRSNKRAMLINLVFLLVVFVVVTFVLPNGSQKNLFTWEETQLIITCPDESVYTVPYDSIIHIQLVTNADLGTCRSGDDTTNFRYGRWENEVLGEYVLCCYCSYSTVIQLTTASEDYWISYESAETTTALYDSIVETLTSEGYAFEVFAP